MYFLVSKCIHSHWTFKQEVEWKQTGFTNKVASTWRACF